MTNLVKSEYHGNAMTFTTAQHSADFLLRRKDVERIAGISRASIYRLIRAGKFPAPVSLGTGAVRWRQSSVTAWLESLTTTAGV